MTLFWHKRTTTSHTPSTPDIKENHNNFSKLVLKLLGYIFKVGINLFNPSRLDTRGDGVSIMEKAMVILNTGAHAYFSSHVVNTIFLSIMLLDRISFSLNNHCPWFLSGTSYTVIFSQARIFFSINEIFFFIC